MRILPDTHILLWHTTDNPLLEIEHSRMIEDPSNAIFLSIVSLWEMAIKMSIGKLAISQPLSRIIPNEMSILPLRLSHILKVRDLEFHHKDPFDRMIISQAMTENMAVMSRDHHFKLYDIVMI